MKELLARLCETFGPSGREEKVRELIKNEIEGHVDEVKIDVMGNLIAKKGKGGKKIMVAAHMDEIGVAVSHIDEKGFIRFGPVGGVFPTIPLGERVEFEGGAKGVVSIEKLYKEKDLALEKMFIDIGASSKEEAEKMVKIGEIGCFTRNAEDLGKRFVAKALDDRVGCLVLIEAIKRTRELPNEVYFVFTTQEEVGLRGARTSAFGVSPDLALAVDVTGTGDTPEGMKMAVELGKGAAIKVKDRGMIVDKRIKDKLIDLAEKNNIPYQLEVLEFGSTDGAVIQLTKEGVITGAISIPARYIHTPSEMCDMDDVEACVKLLCAFLEAEHTL
ncbi:M42 family peptidase [bacterium]|nr:MAG: M42 family peptidase [bacterium]RKZ27064.1 MAG: M42 family peptidase [bacterium]